MSTRRRAIVTKWGPGMGWRVKLMADQSHVRTEETPDPLGCHADCATLREEGPMSDHPDLPRGMEACRWVPANVLGSETWEREPADDCPRHYREEWKP